MRKRRRSIDITRTRVVHARDILSETSDPLKRTRFLPLHVEIMLAASGEARRASSKLSALGCSHPAGAEAFFKECSVPAPSIALPPPSEIPYSEIQEMMTLAPTYGFEFVPPQH